MDWRTSSYCYAGSCLEITGTADLGVLVRDSKDPDGPVLSFSADAWAEFLSWMKAMIPDKERWVQHG